MLIHSHIYPAINTYLFPHLAFKKGRIIKIKKKRRKDDRRENFSYQFSHKLSVLPWASNFAALNFIFFTSWNGWMASPTQQTWAWANSRRWWRTEKPGVLWSMGSQRVRHDLATEQQEAPTFSKYTNQAYLILNYKTGYCFDVWSSPDSVYLITVSTFQEFAL